MSAANRGKGRTGAGPGEGARRHLPPVISAVGVVAAAVVALLVNVVAARHYRRFDVTRSELYTLSPATLTTLRDLRETVAIDVLLPSRDPLAASVRFLLEAYGARTDRLVVRYTDPDRHPAEFIAMQQKYGIEAGRTENGQVVMDASIVLSKTGGKAFFVSNGDLVGGDETGEGRARSRIEQALTTALRSVVDDDRPKVCVTIGHGERAAADLGPRGLGELAARLRKNNYEVTEVDTAASNATDPFHDCRVVVIAGPTDPFAPEVGARIASYLTSGGNLLLMVSPVPDARGKRLVALGLDEVAALGGIVLDQDFVFELDGSRRIPDGVGEDFFAEAKRHEITAGLVGEAGKDFRLLMIAARSLSRAQGGTVAPVELLATSSDAFGMTDFFAWVARGGPPEPMAADRRGPLAVAMAAELAPPATGAGPPPGPGQPVSRSHGPRLVVIGSASLALGQNWQEQALRGGALLIESTMSWLAARPPIVDVPDKPAASTLRISEDSLSEVWRYVVVYMPTAALLLGLAVFLRRRSTEGASK